MLITHSSTPSAIPSDPASVTLSINPSPNSSPESSEMIDRPKRSNSTSRRPSASPKPRKSSSQPKAGSSAAKPKPRAKTSTKNQDGPVSSSDVDVGVRSSTSAMLPKKSTLKSVKKPATAPALSAEDTLRAQIASLQQQLYESQQTKETFGNIINPQQSKPLAKGAPLAPASSTKQQTTTASLTRENLFSHLAQHPQSIVPKSGSKRSQHESQKSYTNSVSTSAKNSGKISSNTSVYEGGIFVDSAEDHDILKPYEEESEDEFIPPLESQGSQPGGNVLHRDQAKKAPLHPIVESLVSEDDDSARRPRKSQPHHRRSQTIGGDEYTSYLEVLFPPEHPTNPTTQRGGNLVFEDGDAHAADGSRTGPRHKRKTISDDDDDDDDDPEPSAKSQRVDIDVLSKEAGASEEEEEDAGDVKRVYKSQRPAMYFQNTFEFKEDRQGYIDFRADVKYIMGKQKVNFDKTFDQQHGPVITNVVRAVQSEYPRFGQLEWVQEITDLVADIIRNKRRSSFRRERQLNPDGPQRKRGRPAIPEGQRRGRAASVRPKSIPLASTFHTAGSNSATATAPRGHSSNRGK